MLSTSNSELQGATAVQEVDEKVLPKESAGFSLWLAL